MCVCVHKGGDGGFRIVSGKGKETGCCQGPFRVSATVCLVGVSHSIVHCVFYTKVVCVHSVCV